MPESQRKKPLIVEVEQFHRCVTIQVTDKLKDVKIKWLTTIGQDDKTYSGLFEVPSDSLDRIVQKLKEQEGVIEVAIMQKGPKTSQIILKEKKELATSSYLAQTNVAWVSPTYTEDGVDKVTMVAPNFKQLKKFINLVGEKGYDLKIKSKRYIDEKGAASLDSFRTSGFTQLKSASELLTDRQMEVFDLACRHGYYEQPKRVTIEELALKLGIGKSTCAELLRKAERKLLPILNEVIRVMK